MATLTDYFKLHFIVLLWGFTAVVGLLISIPAVEMVFYRTLLAALGMMIYLKWRKESLVVSPSDFFSLLAIGIIVSAHWLTFFASARVSNASVSLVGFATNSLWAALLEPLSNRQRIKWIELLLGLIVMAGLYIIFSFDFQYPLGLALGIASGFTAALFSVLNARMVRRITPERITLYEMWGAWLTTALFLPIYKHLWADGNTLNLLPSATDWLYLAFLAWGCSLYAYSVAIHLMKKLSVFFIQLTLNLEPVYGILLALIVFGEKEKMGWNFYLGTIIIVSAVLIYPRLRARFIESRQFHNSPSQIT
ncbi:MAG: EamA family transporter [Cyclobacteriaceae bacterium]|nr:EamA family transporter [Cyclobacteriaceae bacterium]